MKQLNLQKRLAKKVSKSGLKRVRINPEQIEGLKEAITKGDIKALIESKAIMVKQKRTPSRHRARARHAKRKKGRQKGEGKRKGTIKSRLPRKREWINKVRSQRKLIQNLKQKKSIDNKIFRMLYKKIKGNTFRSRAHLMFFLKQNKLIMEAKK